MKKVAIYARVSTEKQEEQKTVESQLAALREVCKNGPTHIVKEYIDDGFSGGTLARPALDQLRDDASRGFFEAVYILSPDRLARKYVYQALVIEELKGRGIEIVFLNKAVTDSPEDQLLLGIQGLVAEYERAKIIERTRRGRLHRARNGEIMGGTAPYGYDYIQKSKDKPAYYKLNEKEAEVVRLMFRLYLRFRSTGKVVQELANRKISTRSNSRFWSKGLIHRILTSESYTGAAYYNKLDKGRGKRTLRERGEWILIKVPRIIDGDTFQMVQKTLKSHKGGKRRRIYILSGLIRCKRCGSNYIGSNANQGRHFYYRCANFLRRFPLPRDCDAKLVKAEEIENAVVREIRRAIVRPEILLRHIDRVVAKVAEKRKNAQREETRLISQNENLEGQNRKLLDLYLGGAISKDAYLEKKREIEGREEVLKRGLEEIKSQVPIDRDLIPKSVKYFAGLAKERMEKLSPEEAQEFLKYLIDEVVFDSYNHEAKIVGHIPKILNSCEESLFHAPPVLSRETWNKNLNFELKVKV